MEKKISVKDLLMQAFLTGWELSDKSIAQDEYLQSAIQVIEVLQVEPENVYAEEGLGLTDGDEVDHLDDLLRADGQWLYYGVEAENFFLIQWYPDEASAKAKLAQLEELGDGKQYLVDLNLRRSNLFMKGNFSMQLSDTERQCLTAILAQYDQHPEVQRMREFIQHGDVTTYQHCKNVVLVSFWLNRRFHLGADETSLAVGAFLHDFYLYDWHKRSSFRGLRRLFEMHGFAHPGSACVNAERCFAITRKEQNIISSHMWPLTFRHVPTCREAVIVCLADKYCAVLESMFQRTRVADTDAGENEW